MRSGTVALLVLAVSALSPTDVRAVASQRQHGGCAEDARIIYRSRSGPLVPTGGSRFANMGYLVPFSGRNDRGTVTSYAFATRDLLCGPYPGRPEAMARWRSRNPGGVYVGLEPDRRTFVVVTSDRGSTYIFERRARGVSTRPVLFHRGDMAISMQRIGDSMDRLTLMVGAGDGRIHTQTVRTASPSTWGAFLSTPFRSSFGAAGKSRRPTAAWTGNPNDLREIVMAWAYGSTREGNRVIRWARNRDYRSNTGWTPARTLVSIPGKDLSDPRVSRWHNETRVYFVEHDPVSGQAAVDYVVSSDHARTWSAVQGIPMPTALGPLTDITPIAAQKSRDHRNPIGVIGAFDPGRGVYELIAFVIAP